MKHGWILWAAAASAMLAAAQPRVILVDIDGIRRDTFEAAYLSGRMPNLSSVLGTVESGQGFGNAIVFENAAAAFPAITMASQASLVTGVTPAMHGIPGNAWFDRKTNRVIDYFSSTGISCVYGVVLVGIECSGGMANKDLRVPTVYEAATAAGKKSTVVFSQYWKGATHPIAPSVSDVNHLIHGTAVDYAKFDAIMMDQALSSLAVDGIPDLFMLYFIGADEVGHHGGTQAQAAYLQSTFDTQLGRLLRTLDTLDPQWRGHTQFIFTSDHGRTDTKSTTQDVAFPAELEKALARAGYESSQFKIVENGGVVHVYLRSKVLNARWELYPLDKDVEAAGKQLAADPAVRGMVAAVASRTRGVGLGYTIAGEVSDAGRISSLLSGLESEHSGDIVLLLKRGRYFGNTESSGAQHGSIYPDDLSIPLVIALGGAPAGRSPAPISTTEIPAIIAAYLGFPLLPAPQGSVRQK